MNVAFYYEPVNTFYTVNIKKIILFVVVMICSNACSWTV